MTRPLADARTDAGVREVEISLYLRDELLEHLMDRQSSLRRTWARFAAMIGRDPKWTAAQIGHTSPSFTFSVYQQVATRRYIDEQAVWTLMRFAGESARYRKSVGP